MSLGLCVVVLLLSLHNILSSSQMSTPWADFFSWYSLVQYHVIHVVLGSSFVRLVAQRQCFCLSVSVCVCGSAKICCFI
jgi:hypothetical protein